MNGEEMNIGTKFGTSKTIKIRPEMRTLLVETSKCGEEHHYKCYGSKLISEMDKVKYFLSLISFKLLGLFIIALVVFKIF